MRVKVELTDEDKIMAIEEFVRNALALSTEFYELEDIYTSLGEVTFRVKTIGEGRYDE